MVKHSHKVKAPREERDGESSGDDSTPPLAQPHRSSSNGNKAARAESVVEVARKAKRKRSSRGSNKQRPINFMPDIIRMYESSSMDDVRSDCALKSSGSAFLNEFASHRLGVLKSNMERTIMSRKQDTMSVQDVLAHVELSTYGDPLVRKRAIRFVNKSVARLEESLEKDEYKKYLEDKKAGKKVVWDKRSRSEKALAKKKAKEAETAANEAAESGPEDMEEESDGEADAAAAPKSKKDKKKRKSETAMDADDVPARRLRSGNEKKASPPAQESDADEEAEAEEEEEEKEEEKSKSDGEEADANAVDGTDTANPNPSDSAGSDEDEEEEEDLGEAGAAKETDDE